MSSIINYVADGSTNQFQIPFTYISQSHVVVTVNDTAATITFINATTVNIAATPASGAKVRIKRVTPATALVDFTDGSTLFEADLDLAHQQNRLIAEESRERADNAIATLDANISNINAVAANSTNITTVATNNANVTTVATNNANITTVAGITANLSAVSGIADQVTRLGTADAVSDMNILATADIVADMNTLATSDIVSDMNTLAGISANVTTVAGISADATTVAGISSDVTSVAGISANVTAVAGDLTNIDNLAAALNASTTFVITIANVGGSNYFHVDGTSHPVLNLFRGNTYTFDVSDSTNTGHPLRFKNADDSSYSTGVVVVGTQGQAGATVTLTVASNAPTALKYYCTVHGNNMGNNIAVASDDVDLIEHEVGLNVDSASIFAETGPISAGVGDKVLSVTKVISDELTQGDVDLTFKTRFYPNDVERSYGPFNPSNPTSVRFSGRQFRMRIEGDKLAAWRVGTMRVEVKPMGTR